MKTHVKALLLMLVVASLFVIAISIISFVQINPYINRRVLAVKTQEGNRELPVHLIIPSIQVDAAIEYVGVDSDGEMGVPKDINGVGWFNLGPRPGEKGSAVIAGHFNGENGEAAVFFNLYKLKQGDKIYTEDTKGVSTVFVVQESHIFDPGYAEEVFSSNDNAHLNLITCDGIWDGAEKSFSKRLVVFADKE